MGARSARSQGQIARRRYDPHQAPLVPGTDDDPRTLIHPSRHMAKPAAHGGGRELVGWTLSPRYYEIVAWRGPKGFRQHRTQRASTLEQARDMARDAIRWDGWDGAWIFPSET